MTLEAIRYNDGKLSIIDQLQLPFLEQYIPIETSEKGWHAIKEMQVRGAPAIAIVAALSLASELHTLVTYDQLSPNAEDVGSFITDKLNYLVSSRPTAVNLSDAARKLGVVVSKEAKNPQSTGRNVAKEFIKAAEDMLVKDLEDNRKIGENGAKWIVENTLLPEHTKVSVLTHCNTGSLATSGYGTALGVIRSLASIGVLKHAYCTETRPYNQGSRLTAFELVHENIPATLITDSMAAALLAKRDASVNAIVVGADRVAANGDTANKVGTYGLAVIAKHHGVKFLVAAPLTTIDLATKSGNEIVIEERPASEVTRMKGPCEKKCDSKKMTFETVRIAADGINVWNPAFDITPATLIDVTRSHKVNDRDHSAVQNGIAISQEHLPRYFAKSGPVDADPKKTKKNGGGRGNWGRSGEEVQDYDYTFTNTRRHSNSSLQGISGFKTKFETVDPEPVFEEDLHGPSNETSMDGNPVTKVESASSGMSKDGEIEKSD